MSSPVPSIPAGATPAMRQFFEAKRQHRDAIVFFRMGDFYEMFYEDALTAARALELTLTSRSKDANGGAIPMCGVPHHAARRLHRAARQEGLPRRHLRADGGSRRRPRGWSAAKSSASSRPGTLTDAGYLDAREPAFLMAIAPAHPGPGYGVALLDLSTGEFTTAEYTGPDATPGARRRAGGAPAARDRHARRVRRSRLRWSKRCGCDDA